MPQYHTVEDFVTAQKIMALVEDLRDAIARLNARVAAAKTAKANDSTYGSTPSSPTFSAISDSTALACAPEDAPIELTAFIEQNVETTSESVEPEAPVAITSEHCQTYSDDQNERCLLREWFRNQSVAAPLEPTEEHVYKDELDAAGHHHDQRAKDILVPFDGEDAFHFREKEADGFVASEQVLEKTIHEKVDSGFELTPPHSDEECELVDKPILQEVSKPQFEHLANVSLAVNRDVYEQNFITPATSPVSRRQVCAFGKCTTACLADPCYPVDQLIDDYRATVDDYNPKTSRIFLDITGKASFISYPRSKALRLLAQKLNGDIETRTIDIQELDNDHAKYLFEIDISKFVRSKNVVVYSTYPITAFYRDLQDETDDFNPCERAQHEITAGHGIEVPVPNLFLGTKAEFEEFADQREFSQDQRDVVVFHEECDDYLNQLDDFGVEVPMHNEMEEVPEYSEEEQRGRRDKAKGFEECRKFAQASAIPEIKDAVVLYCLDNKLSLNLVQEHRRTREEDSMDCEAGVNSLSGHDLLEKTVEPRDKDQVVQRVVAWLEKDDGSYEPMQSFVEENRDCDSCPSSTVNEEQSRLSASALAKYDELIASIEPSLQALANRSQEEKLDTTYEFILTNPTEATAANKKKHIFLSTTDEDTSINFAPPTQKLKITGPITTCHDFDPLAIPSELLGTNIHILTFKHGNCAIYSTQPIAKYTLDYSLPEVKDAPRAEKRLCQKHLRAQVKEYKAWAPYAEKYKMNLGAVLIKDLKNEEQVLGLQGFEEGEEGSSGEEE
ncbi:hypothetical protein FKW77_005861 [Venturia effusa]|uniref:Uncharacterized protein n=1 Tax=Venturia effusa TaxID=50376 RepID=A0A517LHB0_9PEZI|nr:hypothetical protein FKW77_005861 [Venturia effusa]